MLRLMRPGSAQLGLGVAALGILAVAFGTSPAHAFSTETLNGDPSGGSRYYDPDGSPKGMQLFGPGGPTLQFGAGSGGVQTPYSPFRPGANFGSAPSQPTPDPYNLNNPNHY